MSFFFSQTLTTKRQGHHGIRRRRHSVFRSNNAHPSRRLSTAVLILEVCSCVLLLGMCLRLEAFAYASAVAVAASTSSLSVCVKVCVKSREVKERICERARTMSATSRIALPQSAI